MIGNNLDRIMREKGITGTMLSKSAKIHANSISAIKRNKSDPTAAIIKKLSIALECSADNLLFSEEDLEPDQELKMIFKEMEKLPDHEKELLKEVIRAIILKSRSEEIKNL